MQALQELYDETERSHTNLLKSSKEAEERIDKLLSDKTVLEQKLDNLEDVMMEKSIKVLHTQLLCRHTISCFLNTKSSNSKQQRSKSPNCGLKNLKQF